MYRKRKEWLRIAAAYILAFLVIVFFIIFITKDMALAKEDSNSITVKPESFNQEYRNANGDVQLILVFQYPNVAGDYKGIERINCKYTTLFCDWLKSQNELIQSVSEEKVPHGSKYGNEVSYTITYNKNRLLSVLFEGYLYTGGAHGMPYRIPVNLSLDSGEEIDLTKLLKKSKEEIKQEVVAAFTKKFEEKPDEYWENAKDIVSDTKYENLKYYFSEEGIVFYYDPYILAPYAGGFIEASINY